MRELLRAWLGVEDPVDPDLSEFVTKDDIKTEARKLVIEALDEAFSPTPGPELKYFLRYGTAGIRGALDERIQQVSDEYIGPTVARRVSELVEPEKFIDQVVERIRAKQLGA